jgi:nucleoside-diphosphate-sugar epimerase
MSSSSSSPIVLITGVTGFLAAHVLDSVLASPNNYRVRGTTRTLGKKDALLARLGDNAERVELVLVEATEKDDLTEVVKGVTYIAHVASPYQLQVDDIERDLLQPAIEGTLNVLRYAQKEPSVKKIAITSSFAAVVDFGAGGPNRPGFTYTQKDWNPLNREDAKGPVAYAVSKKLVSPSSRV